jgi:acyl carrier protein
VNIMIKESGSGVVELENSQAQKTKVDAERIELWCVDYIARTLNIPASEVDPTAEFYRFGLDSALATAMILDLEEWLGIDIPPSVVFEQVNIRNLAVDLTGRLDAG